VTVLAVTGLRAEARLAAAAGLTAVCAGGVPARTAMALEAALGTGQVLGIVSLGIAGGIAPDLATGTLIIPNAIVGEAGRISTDIKWARRIRERTGGVAGDIVGSDEIIATATDKAALHRRTQSLAVDLESLVVARLAQRAGLPFIALRAIADPASRDLPPAALLPLHPNGTPVIGSILGSILREPSQIVRLVRIANDARIALSALQRGLHLAQTALDPSAPGV
jgi:hopanoid-associated phosphorylase